jgi:NAD(P)-dependent dehydrogenase (short-subunit alcohol dehydrogenase family)
VRLTGKVVVVTGAGGILGQALAERFVSEGAEGLILSDYDTAALDKALSGLDASGTSIRAEPADVRDPAAMDRLVDVAVQDHGRLDVMVNNAGVLSPNAKIHNLTEDSWRLAIDINLLGTVNGIRSAIRVMRPRRSGSIVSTASVAGLTAWAYAAAYCVTKAAIIQLTKVAAVEYAQDNLRVNCVCPGVFPSNMHRDLPDEAMRSLASRHPLGLGTAQDIAGAFVYLASDDARWTTGLALVVDGGYSAP